MKLTRHVRFAALVLVSAGLAACADQTAPNQLQKHNTARPNYLPVNFDIPGYAFVCRVGPANPIANTIDYAIDAQPANGTANFTMPYGTSISLTDGQCDTVVVSGDPYPTWDNDYGENVKATSGALPANVGIDSIVTTEEGNPDVKYTGVDNATVWMNHYHAAEITFYSSYTAPPGGCSLTIGFWKTHAGFTGNNADVVTQYLPIRLGTSGGLKTVTVSTATQAVNVLSFGLGAPSNGVTKLYAQLLGAKFSIASGASGSAVATTIAAADAWLATHNQNDWSSLTKTQQQQVLAWMTTLDNYNNGLIGPGHCG